MAEKHGEKNRAAQTTLRHSFMEQILNCQDGKTLARGHLAMTPKALVVGVTTLSDNFKYKNENSAEMEAPSRQSLEYFQEALRIFGHPEIADLAERDLTQAYLQFQKLLAQGNLDSLIQNANAINLLLP